MGVEANVRDTIQTVTRMAAAHAAGSAAIWVREPGWRCERWSMLFSLFLDHGGRYPWQGLVAALLMAAVAFTFTTTTARRTIVTAGSCDFVSLARYIENSQPGSI